MKKLFEALEFAISEIQIQICEDPHCTQCERRAQHVERLREELETLKRDYPI